MHASCPFFLRKKCIQFLPVVLSPRRLLTTFFQFFLFFSFLINQNCIKVVNQRKQSSQIQFFSKRNQFSSSQIHSPKKVVQCAVIQRNLTCTCIHNAQLRLLCCVYGFFCLYLFIPPLSYQYAVTMFQCWNNIVDISLLEGTSNPVKCLIELHLI